MSATQKHIEKAIGQIQHKDPLPEIDFTQHTMEDGSSVSTQERVIKDVSGAFLAHSLPSYSLY